MELIVAYPLYSAALSAATVASAYYYASSSPAPEPEMEPRARWGTPRDKVDIRIQVFTNENPARFPRRGGLKRSSSHSSGMCDATATVSDDKTFSRDLMTELKSIVLPIKARIDTGDDGRAVPAKEEKKKEDGGDKAVEATEEKKEENGTESDDDQ